MCGIMGTYNLNGGGEYVSRNLINSMIKAISHRGHDDKGYFFINTSNGLHQVLGGEDTLKGCYLQ